jgi:hypothetical protein
VKNYAAKPAEKGWGVAELSGQFRAALRQFALRVVVQHQHLDARGVFARQGGIR